MATTNPFDNAARAKMQNNRKKLRPEQGISYVTPDAQTSGMENNTNPNSNGLEVQARDIYDKYAKDYNLGELGWNKDANTGLNNLSLGGEVIGSGRINPNGRTMVQSEPFNQAINNYITKNGIKKLATPDTMQPQQYQGINMDKMNALTDKILGMKTSKEYMANWNPESNPLYNTLKGQADKLGQTAYENTLGQRGDTINTAIASAASQAKQSYNQDFMSNIVPQLYKNDLDLYNKEYDRNLSDLDMLNTMDTNAYNRYNKEQDRGMDFFQKSTSGLGNQYNFQKDIDTYKNDGDPSNDWRIPILMQQREVKMNNNANDFATTAKQYSRDFQDAINKLDKSDPLYDKKLGILNMYRNEKLAGMEKDKKEQALQDEKVRQFNSTLEEQVRNRMSNDELQRLQLGVSQGNLELNKQIRQDTLTDKKDQTAYDNAYKALSKLYISPVLDEYGDEIGSEIPENKKADLWQSIRNMEKAGTSKEVTNMLRNVFGLE